MGRTQTKKPPSPSANSNTSDASVVMSASDGNGDETRTRCASNPLTFMGLYSSGSTNSYQRYGDEDKVNCESRLPTPKIITAALE